MKQRRLYLLVSIAAVFGLAFLVWAVNQPGAIGLLRVTGVVRWAFIFLGAGCVFLLGLALWPGWFNRRSEAPTARPLAAFLIIISAICIIVFPLAASVLEGLPSIALDRPFAISPLAGQSGQALHFAVGSDSHFGSRSSNSSVSARLLAQIADPLNHYDLLFFLGDLVEFGFRDSHWSQAAKAFSFNPAMPPVRFAPGNHDTLFAGLKRYENYCSPPPSEVASASRLWYRVDMENIHFLVLDLGWSAENYSTGQAAWLEDQLKIIPKSDWKIVLSHGFYYASGFSYQGWKWYDNPETISKLTPLFEKYGVNLAFSGHIHDLELLEHAGVTYAICGGFGGKLDPQRTYQSPASLWYKAGQFGFLDVTIEGNQADLTFRSADSTVLRSFRISKGLADSAY